MGQQEYAGAAGLLSQVMLGIRLLTICDIKVMLRLRHWHWLII
jgi:hypothetical protein